MRFGSPSLLFGILIFLAQGAASAADIPLDEAGFTAYVRGKLQLYSPYPVRVLAPFTLASGGATGANLVYDLGPLHDACVAAPPACPQKIHDYVQAIVRRFPAAAQPPAPAVPSDPDGFMIHIAAKLGALLPGAAVKADGMTLLVTRPGGHAIPFDERGYYRLCGEAAFQCDSALDQALRRAADLLAAPSVPGLRVALRRVADCAGEPKSCTAAPSREPMAPLSRRAFAHLETVCVKLTPAGGYAPVTNADGADLRLGVEAALDTCENSTRAALGPLAPAPPGTDGVAGIAGPFAASRALFAADGAALAAGGHLLIALPQRDLLLYIQGDGPEQIAALAAHARDAVPASGLAIGPDVYRWSAAGWSPATGNGP